MPGPSRSTASPWVFEDVAIGDSAPTRDPAGGRAVARRALPVHENRRRGHVPARPELRQRLLLLLRRVGVCPDRLAPPDGDPPRAFLPPPRPGAFGRPLHTAELHPDH